jgi:hypothetical protein
MDGVAITAVDGMGTGVGVAIMVAGVASTELAAAFTAEVASMEVEAGSTVAGADMADMAVVTGGN